MGRINTSDCDRPTYDGEEIGVVDGPLLAGRLLGAVAGEDRGDGEAEVCPEHVHEHRATDVHRLQTVDNNTGRRQ